MNPPSSMGWACPHAQQTEPATMPPFSDPDGMLHSPMKHERDISQLPGKEERLL